MAAGSRIARRKLRGDLLFANCLEFFRGAEAAIGSAVGQQQLNMFAIDLRALRLAIGAERPSDIRALIPREAKPAERIEDLLLRRCDEAGAIGVFDAQHKFAAALACVDEVDQADVRRADVRIAGGARSDANAHGSFRDVQTIRHTSQTSKPNFDASRQWSFYKRD